MRNETAEFQSRIEAEFEMQRAQLDESVKSFVSKLQAERTIDPAFYGSVAEHLRLARDEGARITADAMVEAEKLGSPESVSPPVALKYDALRDAVDDIGSKDTQSAILKSLVHHASEFAPRGAFFIIKSEHFVGWKVFGTYESSADNAIREIHFPISADTILGKAVNSNITVAGSAADYSGDAAFLQPLQFGEPVNMIAIPLVARGRAVAVLYADPANDNPSNLNREALETLVRVAGMKVELHASNQSAKDDNFGGESADFENASPYEETASEPVTESLDSAPEYVADAPRARESRFENLVPENAARDQDERAGFSFNESVAFEGGFPQQEIEPGSPFSTANPFEAEMPVIAEPIIDEEEKDSVTDAGFTTSPYNDSPFGGQKVQKLEPEDRIDTAPAYEPIVETFEPRPNVFDPEPADNNQEAAHGAMVFDTGGSIEPAAPVNSPFHESADQYEPAGVSRGGGFGHVAEPEAEVQAPVSQPTRRSDRPVDLPIEVPEEERRIHNDARRFARLLVSEIKLYNEKKVIEGREAQDLYDRLREAIDRSREMYDKRVQPPVAAKFDYFHYELVSSLADGNSDRLGSGYPGANV